MIDHLEQLRERYMEMNWCQRAGWGERPAVVVVDLALYWTKPSPMGSNVDSVVEASLEVLEAARAAELPIFFSTWDFDPHEDGKLVHPKSGGMIYDENTTPEMMEIDPRLKRRPTEKLFPKRYASCFSGTPCFGSAVPLRPAAVTDTMSLSAGGGCRVHRVATGTALQKMLTMLRVDTVIVLGVSTSHCVYATCRDATESFNVIVPREAVGERCQIMHMVNLLDIDIDLADVMPTAEVVSHLRGLAPQKPKL
jgi:maleamate amidohydrolase